MAIQYSDAVRNAMLEAMESVVGTTPKLRFYTGAAPATVAAAATGTLLAEIPLPSDWMSAASGGSKSKSGTWQATATAAGVAGYYRLMNSAGTVVHEQGTVTDTSGNGDFKLDNTNIAPGQQIVVNTFTRISANT